MTWVTILINAVFLVVVFFIMVILHEVGHAVIFSLLTKKKFRVKIIQGKIMCSLPEEVKALNKEQFQLILVSGIILGAIPLAFVAKHLNLFAFSFLIVMYLWGCKSDLIQMWRVMEDE